MPTGDGRSDGDGWGTGTLNWIQRSFRQSRGVNKLDSSHHFSDFWVALSNILLIAQILSVPNDIIKNMKRIQKDFLWNSSTVKINHETICSDFQNGGLKNVDIEIKIISWKCSWIKRLWSKLPWLDQLIINLAIIFNLTQV